MQVRTAEKHTQFGRHYVPAGSMIFLCNYLIQRNATYVHHSYIILHNILTINSYWSDPDDFNPSREGIDPSAYGENLSCIFL